LIDCFDGGFCLAVVVNTLVTNNEVNLHQPWLVLGSVTSFGQAHHLSTITNHQVNSAFHPSWVGKSSTSLAGWG